MPLPLDEIRSVIADAVAPRHFFIGNGLELEWQHAPAENTPWEIYKGRLLDASQTRERRTFEAWNIYSIDEFGHSTEPLLSVKLDAESGEVHVVRAILCYAWEAYDAGENVIESRETTKWVRELVRTVDPKFSNLWQKLPDLACKYYLRPETKCALLQAIVGTSRLPLTSLEAPLPLFSLGRLAYLNPSFDQRAPGVGRRWSARLRQAFDRLRGRGRAKAGDAPLHAWRDLVERALVAELNQVEEAKLFETFLHVVPMEELPEATNLWMDRFISMERSKLLKLSGGLLKPEPELQKYFEELVKDPARMGREKIAQLLRALFNETALTPYADLVDKALTFLQILESRARLRAEDTADILGRLLRQLGRHLTAYDLITFHHRGANYPDALVLDAVLKAYLRLIERESELFVSSPQDDESTVKRKRLRRRGLRQGWLLRRQYEGHLVPDAPTSPGENLRVLPPPHARVPEEQITSPAARTKRLYEGDPLDRHLGERAKHVLQESINDLAHSKEVQELGTAFFLDRPFGGGKGPMEPDNTLLFSYVAFSRTIAKERLRYLAKDLGSILDSADEPRFQIALEALEVAGIPVPEATKHRPQAIVSLADTLKVAEDFVLIRTASHAWTEFYIHYPLGPVFKRFSLDQIDLIHPVLIHGDTPPGSERETISIYDSDHRKRMALDFDPAMGYFSHAGHEYPVSPLRILRVWEGNEGADQLRECDLRAKPILLQPPRW